MQYILYLLYIRSCFLPHVHGSLFFGNSRPCLFGSDLNSSWQHGPCANAAYIRACKCLNLISHDIHRLST